MKRFAFWRTTALLCLLYSLTGCLTKTLSIYGPPTAPARRTLVALTQSYLESIAAGDAEKALSFRTFSPSSQDEAGLARDLVQGQIRSAFERTDGFTHPLAGYEITDVLSRENQAKVRLQNKSEPAAKDILVHFLWAGRGWVVTKDNLFGPTGLLTGQ